MKNKKQRNEKVKAVFHFLIPLFFILNFSLVRPALFNTQLRSILPSFSKKDHYIVKGK
jgi:hypothetical protein